MILTADRIKELVDTKQLHIEPFNPVQVGPASYDFRLSNKFATFRVSNQWGRPLDLSKAAEQLETIERELNEGLTLEPGDFVLGMTQEYFVFPGNVAGIVKDKSSLGRLGITCVNGGCGYYDPGFSGYGVLEIKNNGCAPVWLKPGMRIGQMVFEITTGLSSKPYSGNYQVQQDFALDRWKGALKKVGDLL